MRPLHTVKKITSRRRDEILVFYLERAMGLEPTTAAMARRYSSQLSYARTSVFLERDGLYTFFIKIKEKNTKNTLFYSPQAETSQVGCA